MASSNNLLWASITKYYSKNLTIKVHVAKLPFD